MIIPIKYALWISALNVYIKSFFIIHLTVLCLSFLRKFYKPMHLSLSIHLDVVHRSIKLFNFFISDSILFVNISVFLFCLQLQTQSNCKWILLFGEYFDINALFLPCYFVVQMLNVAIFGMALSICSYMFVYWINMYLNFVLYFSIIRFIVDCVCYFLLHYFVK